jgi:hypothetical protein
MPCRTSAAAATRPTGPAPAMKTRSSVLIARSQPPHDGRDAGATARYLAAKR